MLANISKIEVFAVVPCQCTGIIRSPVAVCGPAANLKLVNAEQRNSWRRGQENSTGCCDYVSFYERDTRRVRKRQRLLRKTIFSGQWNAALKPRCQVGYAKPSGPLSS